MAVSALFLALSGAAAPGSVDAGVEGLRSTKGIVLVCLTTRPDHFPNCQQDPLAHRVKLPADAAQAIRFDGLPSGGYALALIHDENGNGRLDTFARIPREGVGFSRNPRLSFGPPRFDASRFAVTSGATGQQVRVKYFL